MAKKNIENMTRHDFETLPMRKKWDAKVMCSSLVILPMRRMHDSGFRCMDFVAVDGPKAICRLSGCSDVIHVDGIGGYGDDWLSRYGVVPSMIPPSGWSVDCLPKSGLLRIFPGTRKMSCGAALSSFEIYCVHEKAQAKRDTEAQLARDNAEETA